jgi:N-acetylglucosamine kinase-like BadF-type ATPase
VIRKSDWGVSAAHFGTVNPASVGEEKAAQNWAAIAAHLMAQSNGRTLCGWIASADVSEDTIDEAQARIVAAFHRQAARGFIAISNDVVPLLFAAPIAGQGGVLVAGTGSCACGARRGDRLEFARSGGYEFWLSDEGSAFWMGLLGLRAAARAFERGRPSKLVRLAERRFGAPIPTLGRSLARSVDAKVRLAEFAIDVLSSLDAEPEATCIVFSSASALAGAAETIRRRLGFAPTEFVVGMAGGLFENEPFRRIVEAHLAENGCRATHVVADGRQSLELAADGRRHCETLRNAGLAVVAVELGTNGGQLP